MGYLIALYQLLTLLTSNEIRFFCRMNERKYGETDCGQFQGTILVFG